MKTDSIDEPIHVSLYTPAALRWGLSAFGLVLVVLAGKDLLRVLWPLSIFTPFFVLLMGTGVAAGAGLIIASQWGPDERWQIDNGRLSVVHTRHAARRERVYTLSDIAAGRIDTVDWDSRPDTYRLVVMLHTGKPLNSPHFSTHAAAEAALNRLLANSRQ